MIAPRVNILGVGVSAINLDEAVDHIAARIGRREPGYVCIRDVHGLVACRRDERLRRIHNAAALVTPDGMPLVWISRWRGHGHVGRVYGPDLLLAVCARSQAAGFRHFFYGGGEGVAERLAARLGARFPGLIVAGTYAPPFRPLDATERCDVVRHINDSGADIVWVGLSTPKQEMWMAENRAALTAPVLVGVGAAFDFHSGAKRQAPKWLQRSGFEWLFRLAAEPRRLWRRYLIVVPTFLVLYLLQALRIRRFPMRPAGD